jgi:hypothetical protein
MAARTAVVLLAAALLIVGRTPPLSEELRGLRIQAWLVGLVR